MVGRWAQWKGYPKKIRTNTACSFCLNFMHMNPRFMICTWTLTWPKFLGLDLRFSSINTMLFLQIFAGSLGFKGLFLHKNSPDFSSIHRNCRRSRQGQRGQASAWRTTIIDPSSSQDSSFALGHPVTASCTACPTWGRRPRVHEAVKFKIPLRKMRMIRRGIAGIAFDWKNKTEDLDHLDKTGRVLRLWANDFNDAPGMSRSNPTISLDYTSVTYLKDPKGSVSTNWSCPWHAADPQQGPPWLL